MPLMSLLNSVSYNLNGLIAGASKQNWNIMPGFHIIVTVGNMSPINRRYVLDPFLQIIADHFVNKQSKKTLAMQCSIDFIATLYTSVVGDVPDQKNHVSI